MHTFYWVGRITFIDFSIRISPFFSASEIASQLSTSFGVSFIYCCRLSDRHYLL
jgi:hypothetical protein